MAMIPETMHDILDVTRQLHRELSQHLSQSADDNASERSQMLLNYLAEHEERLARTLETFQKKADLGSLDTWFYEYTDRHRVIHLDPAETPFAKMEASEIEQEMGQFHDQLIDLYTHLHERAENNTAKEVLAQLLELETTKAKLISFESGRSQEF